MCWKERLRELQKSVRLHVTFSDTVAQKQQHTLWCGKVDDVSVLLEHIDLLDCLDGLDVQLLQRRL